MAAGCCWSSEPVGANTVLAPEAVAGPAAPVEVAPPDNDPPGTVRLVCAETDVAKRYKWIVPPLPFPPFSRWRQWWTDHEIAVHCALEWKDANGKWFYAEMRNAKWDDEKTAHRVGLGQVPGLGYIAYNIYIFPGRVPRTVDKLNRPMVIVLDEVIQKCDYKKVEAEIRKYGAFGKSRGDRGTGNYGKENCGLGGPAYKPSQNSNTMVNYVLRKCGVKHSAPDRAVGWDTVPRFPYSSDAHYPKYDNQP